MKNYFNKIIQLFEDRDVSPSTRDAFHHWLVSDNHFEKKDDALQGLWNRTAEGSLTEYPSETKRALNAVHRKTGKQQAMGNKKRVLFWQIAAACILALFISSLFFKTNNHPVVADLIEQYVPVAGMSNLTLPDGTEVQMNSTATLLYPEHFTGETRSVYLIGEAYFKVAKNEKQPFIVKSNDFQVRALGTEFNVRAYSDNPLLSVTLLSGSVEVSYNNLESSRILVPNEQFSYNRFTKVGIINRPNLDDVTAWQRGELIFKSATLEEIIVELERKYSYTFVYTINTLKEDKYTFRFKNDTPFKEVMDIITEVSGHLRYRVDNNKCYLLPS